jgi:hypothetical protein
MMMRDSDHAQVYQEAMVRQALARIAAAQSGSPCARWDPIHRTP